MFYLRLSVCLFVCPPAALFVCKIYEQISMKFSDALCVPIWIWIRGSSCRKCFGMFFKCDTYRQPTIIGQYLMKLKVIIY